LDQEGDVKNIYTGHPNVNHENILFYPTGIGSNGDRSYKESINSSLPDGMTWIVDLPTMARSRSSELVSVIL
jgi:hypothetical protein